MDLGTRNPLDPGGRRASLRDRGGGQDDGIALFELLLDGQLHHHQSLAQSQDWQIGAVQALQAQVQGDQLQIRWPAAPVPSWPSWCCRWQIWGCYARAAARATTCCWGGRQ